MKGEVNPGMESVRKLVSGRLETRSAGPHPDADSLSAFAENALSATDRGHVLTHLADCGGCREIVFLLSASEPAESQKVVILRPGRWYSALRWGSAVASIVVLVGVFAARHELFQSPPRLGKTATASQLPTNSKVAEEKIPADLGSMRQLRSENRAVKTPVHVPERARPDLKHMTAKMQPTLTFGQSDEVQVSSAASPNTARAVGAFRDLPLPAGNAPHQKDAFPGQPAAAQQQALSPNPLAENDKSEVAVVANHHDMALVQNGTRALAKQAALQPRLAGTVLDASGAVVPNAKVTTVGPVATETVTSDGEGRFAFDALTPGLYSVKADASGFQSVELKQLAIAANQSPSLKLTLAPGVAAETVEVAGQTAELESAIPDADISANAVAAKRKAERQGTPKAAPRDNTAADITPALQWTLSPAGAVQSSNDGGKTWQMVGVVANTSFRALSAVGASVWVGGLRGILYHSLDAGRKWIPVVPVIQGQKLNSDIARIEFLDSRDGSLSTSNGETWITHDGGNSWGRN